MSIDDDASRTRRFRWLGGSVFGALLVGAFATTWIAPGSAELSRWLLRALVWMVLTSLLLFGWRRRAAAPPWGARVLVTALFALVAYSNFGRFHGDGRFCHTHELYHYHRQQVLSRARLRRAPCRDAARALVEIDARHGDHIAVVRICAPKAREFRGDAAWRRVRRAFQSPRWAEFRADIETSNRRLSPSGWQRILADHGFNATRFGRRLAAHYCALRRFRMRHFCVRAPRSAATPRRKASVAARVFDGARRIVLVAMWAADLFAPFSITGGAYLRQLWLCASVAFVVAMQRGRAGAAGVWLAIATLDRVFPLIFGIWPLTRWIIESVERRRLWSPTARFPLALLVSGVLGVSASSAAVGGVGSWVHFFANIETHQASFFTNQIALRSVFVIDPVAAASARASPDESQWLRDKARLIALRLRSLVGSHSLRRCLC